MSTATKSPAVRVHGGAELTPHLDRLAAYVSRGGNVPLSRHPAWLLVLERGLGHVPYCLEAVEGGRTCGVLPLAYVRSALFGRFLTSLPYLDYGGVRADDVAVAAALIDRAVELAERLDVRYLELRGETPVEHPAVRHHNTEKAHMRLGLPGPAGGLWSRLPSKVRNQVRKGQKSGLTVAWGGEELLPDFYAVFSHNMRDLGTPVYGRSLFRHALRAFPGRAELCVVRAGGRAAAAALVLHGWGVSEVTSAASLRRSNILNCNMLMYYNMLERADSLGQAAFDFGRSSRGSNTYNFKKQWGAEPRPADWQYYLRAGGAADMRPNNPRYRRLISLWRRLPVPLTRLIGPAIVRGIP